MAICDPAGNWAAVPSFSQQNSQGVLAADQVRHIIALILMTGFIRGPARRQYIVAYPRMIECTSYTPMAVTVKTALRTGSSIENCRQNSGQTSPIGLTGAIHSALHFIANPPAFKNIIRTTSYSQHSIRHIINHRPLHSVRIGRVKNQLLLS